MTAYELRISDLSSDVCSSDLLYSARMRYCGPKGIPLEEFLKWSQSSQDAALEWQAHEDRRCRQCGYHPDEHPSGVHAHVDVCPGCAARAKGQKALTAADDGAAVRLATGDRKSTRLNSSH